MQGDFSRSTFDKSKHRRLVLRQQGRVDVDADWNEQQAILRHYAETEAADVIGQAGVPVATKDGFKITVDPDGTLWIEPGRIYVDGILCENELRTKLFAQPDLPATSATAGGPGPLPKAGKYVVYLDVWLRHLTAVDDGSIREKALGGPDTASRAKVVWQVRLLDVTAAANPPMNCGAFPPASFIKEPGTLAAHTATPSGGTGPCVLPPEAGFRRLQNQLYRVQIHTGGDGATATYKWSRENGSVVTGVTFIKGQSLTVQDLGRDDNLGFHDGDWVELLDDASELNDFHGALLKIDTVSPDTNVINISSDTPVIPQDITKLVNTRLRRWDQSGVATGPGNIAAGLPVPAPGAWVPLEDGLEVNFGGGNYAAGDYWLIPARTAVDGQTGNIEWPGLPGSPEQRAPLGIHRHYAALAMLDTAATPVVTDDCRKTFPPLTGLAAPPTPEPCRCCAITLSPDQDWQKALADLQASLATLKDKSASICFQVGTYTVDPKKGPIVLSGFTSLKLTGGGAGSRIISPAVADTTIANFVSSEAVFKFVACDSVEVSDLYVESQQITQGKDRNKDNLVPRGSGIATGRQGVLTFLGCRSVSVVGATLRCADGTLGTRGLTRTSSCITVYNPPTAGTPAIVTSVRIRHCDLTVGHYQIGIQVSNADRLQVEDNILTANPVRTRLTFTQILQDKAIRGNIRKLLVSEAALQPAGARAAPAAPAAPAPAAPAPAAPAPRRLAPNGSVTDGGAVLAFHTPRSLTGVWPKLLADARFSSISAKPVQARLRIVADRVLTDPKLRRGNLELTNWFNLVEREWLGRPTPAAQGIVVGGQAATDVRILNNTLTGFAQGIHIGLSDRGTRRDGTIEDAPTKSASAITVSGNTVQCFASQDLSGREGIFVGNCGQLIVHANRLTSIGTGQTNNWTIDGIRVFGFVGPQLLVTANVVVGFLGGVHVKQLDQTKARPPVTVPPLPALVRQSHDNYVLGPTQAQQDPLF